jgi:hypothetical protein
MSWLSGDDALDVARTRNRDLHVSWDLNPAEREQLEYEFDQYLNAIIYPIQFNYEATHELLKRNFA